MEDIWKNLENSLWIKGFLNNPKEPTEIRYHKFVGEPTAISWLFPVLLGSGITRAEKTYGWICPTLRIGRTAAEEALVGLKDSWLPVREEKREMRDYGVQKKQTKKWTN